MQPSIRFLFLVLLSISLANSSNASSVQENFLGCLALNNPSIPIYTPDNSSFSSILQFPVNNLRFLSPNLTKPQLIITPLDESHVQTAVICSRKNGVEVKVRSGGHDYEGLSTLSDVPFIILDLFNLRSIDINIEDNTAWVQSGALVGELYYKIANESNNTLAFPAGICVTVGIGGHFSGGGYGTLMRKYGLAADNVIDARIVNVDGKLIDKESMGDDLFWAIRGGGGGPFGIVLSWKIKLVKVPIVVTVFTVAKTLEQGATDLVHRWQYVGDKLPKELFVRLVLVSQTSSQKTGKTVKALFQSMFLGSTKELLTVMKEQFHELGVQHQDCHEMSWIQSALFFDNIPLDSSLDVLLNRTQNKQLFKAKSDYVQEPIPKNGLEGIWEMIMQETQNPVLIFTPYGGRMSEISESQIPFPHRKGNLYMIQYLVYWDKEGYSGNEKHMDWMRRLYDYTTPYVSNFPRAAYINYRDIDLGHSKNGTSSYSEAEAWGRKYFKSNFERLVQVKSRIDPDNFFRNEQGIPVSSTSHCKSFPCIQTKKFLDVDIKNLNLNPASLKKEAGRIESS